MAYRHGDMLHTGQYNCTIGDHSECCMLASSVPAPSVGEPSLEDLAIQAADFLESKNAIRGASHIAFALRAKVQSLRAAATQPAQSKSVIKRLAAQGAPVTGAKCVKCGHSGSLYDGKVCIKSTGHMTNCGCHCVFPTGASAGRAEGGHLISCVSWTSKEPCNCRPVPSVAEGETLTNSERADLQRAIAESDIAGCSLENTDIDALVNLFESWLERRPLSVLLALAVRVVIAARRFCEDVQEDSDGVPQTHLAQLNDALDAYEGIPHGVYDDSETVKAGLSMLATDPHATDAQRRIATLALAAARQSPTEEKARRAADAVVDEIDLGVDIYSLRQQKVDRYAAIIIESFTEPKEVK